MNWEVVATPMEAKPDGPGWEPFGMAAEKVVWKRRIASELLSAREVREWLGVSETTLRRWVRRRTLPSPIYVGSNRRWRRAELRALLEGC